MKMKQYSELPTTIAWRKSLRELEVDEGFYAPLKDIDTVRNAASRIKKQQGKIFRISKILNHQIRVVRVK